MIVWVASFPRSGNTFLRIVLRRLYGIRTSTVYDVDGVAERLGKDLVGFTDRPGSLSDMRASNQAHFVKTHRQRDADVDEDDRAICLVRDGRDALVSWARQASEEDPDIYQAELRSKILRGSAVGTGSWGTNVLSWLRPPAPHRVVLRYEDLIRDPQAAVNPIIATVAPALGLLPQAAIPSLDELRRHDALFFRRGRTGSHQDELPVELHQLFWSQADNQAAMNLLGYPKPDDCETWPL
ncbi:sulfotransferase domain-containing protein [Actinoplanes solisilvae]|uniref:sulfotransferase domain-containing protein n=1 Tax=Actinoplanes solisilvae TaxID=2486853 RepID=UPI000FDC5818|nr:sulfotransferase domain-containing protein [Actinoplanes solisilvae]